MEWKIEELLPPEAIEVLKQESINVNCVNEQDGKLYAEIEFYSTHGGDQIFTIWFDKPAENVVTKFVPFDSFLAGWLSEQEAFDIDEYVKLWLENSAKCPLSARELVEDAEDVSNTLETVYAELVTVYNNL